MRIEYVLFIKSLLKLVSCEYYVISAILVFFDFINKEGILIGILI